MNHVVADINAAKTESVEMIVMAYLAAWNEADDQTRRRLLELAWCETAVYSDPTARVVGQQALGEHIHAFTMRYPGVRLELTSPVSAHHDYVHFTWRATDGDGFTLREGRDIGQVASDGRLRTLVGFFGV
ncbi:nuclear transport factor 2 family protein (plasmid) [Deinococcus sp. KNUC1210]|uniref:nuclear transport factor 2 family protein n=1 Tax=Deinococcus sp. KNUC1210 TaxID=2917691 RepID=UPI001EF09AFB|nr:nuclear transport factor 2 family protein [Deinococcus sp. KNUC1210]ULH17122.1 nuclear transport factor 2 family protein [Deinococcus sp. KNUC1210]